MSYLFVFPVVCIRSNLFRMFIDVPEDFLLDRLSVSNRRDPIGQVCYLDQTNSISVSSLYVL